MNLQARITDITTGLQSDKADVLAKISDELLAVTASIDNHTAEMISLKIEVTKNLNQNTSSIEKSKSGMVAKVKQERCSIIQSIDAQSTHIRGLKKDVISKVEDELCAVIESVDNQSAGVKQLGRLSPMLSKNPRPNLPPIGTKFSPSFKISALKSSNKLMPSPTKRKSFDLQPVMNSINRGIAIVKGRINDLEESFELQPVLDSVDALQTNVEDRFRETEEAFQEIKNDAVKEYDLECAVKALRSTFDNRLLKIKSKLDEIHSKALNPDSPNYLEQEIQTATDTIKVFHRETTEHSYPLRSFWSANTKHSLHCLGTCTIISSLNENRSAIGDIHFEVQTLASGEHLEHLNDALVSAFSKVSGAIDSMSQDIGRLHETIDLAATGTLIAQLSASIEKAINGLVNKISSLPTASTYDNLTLTILNGLRTEISSAITTHLGTMPRDIKALCTSEAVGRLEEVIETIAASVAILPTTGQLASCLDRAILHLPRIESIALLFSALLSVSVLGEMMEEVRDNIHHFNSRLVMHPTLVDLLDLIQESHQTTHHLITTLNDSSSKH
ncbi:hypothetical protein F5882DRAFT_471409 [Hyaloscypha sp. PMI_1271]|nr:hypothetical protein F5882DRAFT_471409 [Hyaloscypha sp. PMI_1271]